MHKVQFKKWNCSISFGKYSNGRTALQLVQDGELIAVATVNIPEAKISENEVIIKSWSENAGMADNLIEAKIIGPIKAYVTTGFVAATVHELLITLPNVN